jgi:hypothetical protein
MPFKQSYPSTTSAASLTRSASSAPPGPQASARKREKAPHSWLAEGSRARRGHAHSRVCIKNKTGRNCQHDARVSARTLEGSCSAGLPLCAEA